MLKPASKSDGLASDRRQGACTDAGFPSNALLPRRFRQTELIYFLRQASRERALNEGTVLGAPSLRCLTIGEAMFQTAATASDWLGMMAFAVTGALVASRKGMDVVGFIVLGTVTGIGGGTLRDILLNVPIFWIHQPLYLVMCAVVSALVFFAAHIPRSQYRFILWLDAVGLAIFAVTGAEKAAQAGTGVIVAIAMGVVTATFGGIVRDLLGGQTPVILSREIYASAALAGAIIYLVLTAMEAPRELAVGLGFATGLFIRGAALRFGWSLPRYGARPDAGDPS